MKTGTTSLRMPFLAALAACALGVPSMAEAGESRDICDQLAASKFDTTRPSGFPGVDEQDIDIDKALPACQDASAGGTGPRYTFQLGRVLSKQGMKAEAIALYEQASTAGLTIAMVNLGAALEEDNPAQAFAWYRKASEAGDMLGSYNLGVAYENGIGVEVSGPLALEAYRKASDQGDGSAAYNAAVLLDEGTLIPADKPEAVRLYTLAIDRNNADAMFNLAQMYEKGEEVGADKARALELYRRAAALGDTEAADNAKRLEAAD
ncbi:MAG: tetratricopeptide repeat protein [Hoeflea sp.]|uniref:tetratricopeptide repeat protein n=1 Tax=Hoeflea sp. TaxID=1940281 RepID=UPI00272FE76E|nr:tetratricopeptide repeat protein [Hoeflea sp.]MDP2122230.1 tetratricopeptide repeat protein [Hoeflea sp.]